MVYTLPRPWPNASGVDELVMAPVELLKRLAALIPSPGTHMTRYHGVFANRSKFRRRVPAPPPRVPSALEARVAPSVSPSSERGTHRRRAHAHRQRFSWAQLLARVFLIDVLHCPACGGRRRIVSFLTDPKVVRRILTHLGLPTEAPVVRPARMVFGTEPMLDLGADTDVDPDLDPDDDPWSELGTTEDERAPP